MSNLKNYTSVVLYYLRYNKVETLIFILSTLALFYSILDYIISINKDGQKWIKIIITGAIFVTNFINWIYKSHKNKTNGYVITNIPIDYKKTIPETNYKIEGYKTNNGINYITYSDILNQELIECNNRTIKIKIDNDKKKSIHEFIKKNFKHLFLFIKSYCAESLTTNRNIYNESKLCLSKDIKMNDSVYCYKNSYYDSIVTNMTVNKQLTKSNNREIIFKHPENAYLENNKIKSITCTKLNNHIGVSTIAITKDNYIFLWIQNDKSMSSIGLIAPSGSGSCDWKDFIADDFIKTIKNAMKRELIEESMHKRNNNKIESKTLITGFFRWLDKGGKPEFVGITKLNIYITNLRANINEVMEPNMHIKKTSLNNNFGTLQEFETLLKDLLNNKAVSVPLHYNINTILSTIKTNPTLIENFINHQFEIESK
ncbi:hypothetical protein [Alistipes sp. ZOR0009]|uniref:hypothetical protein n=1 Tax=Alistipes sp. ZOR0009 TaxID=1339253 RepID=UPI0006478091|nr:hypothetical protein [Alistipes sp. ZOR0009]